MSTTEHDHGRMLVVDDNRVNRLVLQQALEALGHETVPAEDGLEALSLLADEPFDAVLLDVEMPGLDGYGTLQKIKTDSRIAHIPVIMVSGVEDTASVVRCIELGAVDFLPKPFNAAVLRARVGAALAAKRIRDRELDVIERVGHLVDAAAAVEESRFDRSMLTSIAEQDDAIGALGRVFRQMAERVVEREQRLRHQIEQLRTDAADARDAAGSSPTARLASYLAIDRRLALAAGRDLPTRAEGAVLLADVSGFTAAVAARSRALGGDRGAEELLRDLNGFYDQVVAEIHRFGGAVVGYAGDGMTSWFGEQGDDHDPVRAAVAAGLAVQEIATSSGEFTGTGLKLAVGSGSVRRHVVGDPDIRMLDVLCGAPVAAVTALERHAERGELLVTTEIADELDEEADLQELTGERAGRHLTAVTGLSGRDTHVRAWPALEPGDLAADTIRPWIMREVFDQIVAGNAGFLAELREVTALFVGLDGLRLDDDDAGARLDDVVRWVQEILARHHGTFVQFTPVDGGGYVYACFGAPRSVADDAAAAFGAAAELRRPPARLGLTSCRVGLARGPMRVGAYGGSGHRAYGALGEQTNLAARLMQVAEPAELLADATVVDASGHDGDFEPADARTLKGISEPVPVFRMATETGPADALDDLDPRLAATTKIASIFTSTFDADALAAVHPDVAEAGQRETVGEMLDDLCAKGVITRVGDGFSFADPGLRLVAYERLLFTQRRTLHREALQHLEALEPTDGTDAIEWFRTLAAHATAAEDDEKAAGYLEQAAKAATELGRADEAVDLLERSLRIERGDEPA